MTDLKPLQAILGALDIGVPDKTLKSIVQAYEAYKDKGIQLTLEDILKIKEK